MSFSLKAGLLPVAGLAGAALLYPLYSGGPRVAEALPAGALWVQAPDTAVVRLHISKMTCGTCPATARLALKKLPGVYAAQVTFEDSLGVVRYDPTRVKPHDIAAHLTRLTGFDATVLPDSGQLQSQPRRN